MGKGKKKKTTKSKSVPPSKGNPIGSVDAPSTLHSTTSNHLDQKPNVQVSNAFDILDDSPNDSPNDSSVESEDQSIASNDASVSTQEEKTGIVSKDNANDSKNDENEPESCPETEASPATVDPPVDPSQSTESSKLASDKQENDADSVTGPSINAESTKESEIADTQPSQQKSSPTKVDSKEPAEASKANKTSNEADTINVTDYPKVDDTVKAQTEPIYTDASNPLTKEVYPEETATIDDKNVSEASKSEESENIDEKKPSEASKTSEEAKPIEASKASEEAKPSEASKISAEAKPFEASQATEKEKSSEETDSVDKIQTTKVDAEKDASNAVDPSNDNVPTDSQHFPSLPKALSSKDTAVSVEPSSINEGIGEEKMSKENEPLKVTEASTAQPRSDTESALPSYASKAAKSPEQTVSHDKHQEKKQVTSDEKSHQVETDHQVETHQAEADKKEDSSESEMKKSEENSEEKKLNYTQISDSTQKLDDSTMTSEMSRSFEVVGQPSSDAVKENKAAAVVASEEKTGSRDARMKSNPFEVLEETSTDAESMDNDQKTKASEPSKPADDEGDVNVNASKTNAEIPISIPSELSALSVLPTVQEDLRVPMTSSSTENRSAVDHATEQSCDDNARDQDQESSTEAPVPKDDTELPASSTATKEEENHDEAQESGQDRTLHDADASSDTGLPEMDNQKMSSEEETSLAPEPTEDVDSANTEPLKPQKNADDKRNMSAHEAGSDIKDAKKSKEAPARDSLAHVDDTVTAKSEPYVATEVDVREEPLDHSFEMVDKSSEAADNEAESDMAASSVEDQKKNDNSKAEEKADRSYELVTPSSEESPVKPHEQPRPSEAAGTTESTESQDAQTNKAEKSSSDVTPEQPSTGTEDHKEGTLPDVEPEVSAEEPSQIPSEPIIPINPDDITLSEFSASSDEESDDNESLTDQEAYEDTAGEEVDKENFPLFQKHMDEINAKAPKDQEEFYRASYAIFADILKYQTAQLNSQSQKAAFTARDKSQIIRCAKDYIHLLHSYLNHTSSHASQPTEIDYLRDMVQIWDLCDILCFTQDDTISTVSVCNWLNTHWPLEERRSQGDNTASIDWKLVHRHLLRLNIHEAVHLLQLGLDDYSNRLRAEIERVIGLLKAVPIIHHHQHGLPNLRVWREQVLEAYQSFLRQSDASESDANILQIYKILAGDGQTVIEVGNYFEALIGILFYNLQFYSYGFADLAAVAAQLPFHEQDRVLRVCSSLLQNDWDTALASYDDYWFQAHFGHLLVALGFVSDVDQQVDVTGPIAFVMAAHAQYIGKTYQMWFEAVDYICASGASEGGAWMENLLEDTRKVQDMSFLQKVLAKCEHFKADSAQRYIHKAMARIYEKEGDLRSGAKHYAQAEDTAALDMMADKFMNEFVMRGKPFTVITDADEVPSIFKSEKYASLLEYVHMKSAIKNEQFDVAAQSILRLLKRPCVCPEFRVVLLFDSLSVLQDSVAAHFNEKETEELLTQLKEASEDQTEHAYFGVYFAQIEPEKRAPNKDIIAKIRERLIFNMARLSLFQ